MTDPQQPSVVQMTLDKKENVRQHLRDVGEGRLIQFLVAFEMRDEDIFPRSAFMDEMRSMKASKYWQYFKMNAEDPLSDFARFCDLAAAVHSCPPSSAGVERLFSAYSLTQTKIRNRLTHPRVAKLVTVQRALMPRQTADKDDDLSLILQDY